MNTAENLANADTLSPPVLRVTLNDGSRVMGRIAQEDSSVVRLVTLSNITMDIPRSQIRDFETLSGYVSGSEFYHGDPNATRLLFAPTARSLKSGRGYLSFYQIFFPFVAVGAADFLTLGGGISLFPFATGQIIYFAPKITPIHVDHVDVAGGVLNRAWMGVYGNRFLSKTCHSSGR